MSMRNKFQKNKDGRSEKSISNSNGVGYDDRWENSLLQYSREGNTNVHWPVLVMDTVAEGMYYSHSEDRDGSVVVGDDDGACLLS